MQSRWRLGNIFRPPRLSRDPRRRCRYLFHSTRQSLQLPNSRGPIRAEEQFCPTNGKRERNSVEPMGEAGSAGVGGPMRKAHGAALMCHSLQQTVEGSTRWRKALVLDGLLHITVLIPFLCSLAQVELSKSLFSTLNYARRTVACALTLKFAISRKSTH